jgi:hypothetical protein
MAEDQKPPYLREWLTSQGNVYAFLASTAAAAVLSIPFGFGIGAVPLIAFVAGDIIASMFIPASITYRDKIDRKYRQRARQDARNHLLDEISRRSPSGKQYDRTLNIFSQMRQRIDSLYRLAGDHGSQFSERDIDKLDEASMDYLYAQLALLVIVDRAASIDLKEIDARVQAIDKELTAPPAGADVRQLQKARADYQALAARHRRMLSRKTALEAAVLSMPDQMEEIYQMIVAAPRSHELGVKLSEAVGNLRLREEIEGEVADDLQSSIPGIVVPLHQTNARRAAAQTAA